MRIPGKRNSFEALVLRETPPLADALSQYRGLWIIIIDCVWHFGNVPINRQPSTDQPATSQQATDQRSNHRPINRSTMDRSTNQPIDHYPVNQYATQL
eukprot:gene18086-biopygen15952